MCPFEAVRKRLHNEPQEGPPLLGRTKHDWRGVAPDLDRVVPPPPLGTSGRSSGLVLLDPSLPQVEAVSQVHLLPASVTAPTASLFLKVLLGVVYVYLCNLASIYKPNNHLITLCVGLKLTWKLTNNTGMEAFILQKLV